MSGHHGRRDDALGEPHDDRAADRAVDHRRELLPRARRRGRTVDGVISLSGSATAPVK
jgi:hypothetical protein